MKNLRSDFMEPPVPIIFLLYPQRVSFRGLFRPQIGPVRSSGNAGVKVAGNWVRETAPLRFLSELK